MNARTRAQRSILRQRKRNPWFIYAPTTFRNGVTVLVRRSEEWPDRADYKVRGAVVFGVFPPGPSLMREITSWLA